MPGPKLEQERAWQRQTTKYVANGLLSSCPVASNIAAWCCILNFSLRPFLSIAFSHSLFMSLSTSCSLFPWFCPQHSPPAHSPCVYAAFFPCCFFTFPRSLSPPSPPFSSNLSVRLSGPTVTISDCNSLRKSKALQCSTVQEEIMCYMYIQIYRV